MNTAIIVAGGSGLRIGGDIPKQFLEAHGKPIIITCVENFDRHDEIHQVIVVCRPEYAGFVLQKAKEFGIRKLKSIADAGKTRQESVLSGLSAAAGSDIVLIHDAARPLVSQRIISDNIHAVKTQGAAVTAIPAIDTTFISKDGVFAGQSLARDEMFRAQTPQSFRYDLILSAHKSANAANATDDCQLALAAGYKVAIVKGDELNFKITTPEDLERFISIAQKGQTP